MNIISELDGMEITTIQQTKVFYFIPVGGWQSGVNYRDVEMNVKSSMDSYLNSMFSNVTFKLGTSRYFEYYLSTENNTGSDSSDVLHVCINYMLKIAEENNLELRTIIKKHA